MTRWIAKLFGYDFPRKIKFLILAIPGSFFEIIFRFFENLLPVSFRELKLIPPLLRRIDGVFRYSEWFYVAGIFRTLIYDNLKNKNSPVILDIGCGSGMFGLTSKSFVQNGGKYIGLDVMKKKIDFSKNNYNLPYLHFIHLKNNNAFYAPEQRGNFPWPIEDGSVDLITALSVWTHLKEEDAVFYFKEIERVLRFGGRAIITFCLVDEIYYKNFNNVNSNINKLNLNFTKKAYNSDSWLTTKWASVPERAIGIKIDALKKLTSKTNLNIIKKYPGYWKAGDTDGFYIQDILIFEKRSQPMTQVFFNEFLCF